MRQLALFAVIGGSLGTALSWGGSAQAEPPAQPASLSQAPASPQAPASVQATDAPRNAATHGDGAVAAPKTHSDAPPRTYVSMSFGGTTMGPGALMCAEVAPSSVLSIGACGNGSGFLHREAAPEVAHFRASVTVWSWRFQSVWLQPRAHIGFAELQIGEDTPGFELGGVSPSGMSTAGPEVGGSLRGLWPIYGGFEMIGEAASSLAYFGHAPRLARPQSEWQPQAMLTLGVGY